MPAKLTVNLNNLKYNVNKVKETLKENQELLVMIKADAYGAGIVEVAKCLEKIGVKHFGVAYLKEAITLRNHSIKGNITVFSGLVPNEYEQALNVDAIYSVSNLESLEDLDILAKDNEKIIKIQLAIDTGMTRLGFDEEKLDEVIDKLNICTNIEVCGIYSHLSQADTSDEFTKKQIETFDRCVEKFKVNGVEPRFIHLCNSAGILKYNSDKYNIVRLGIMTYGCYPDTTMQNDIDLKGIFKLTAPVCNIREVEAGREVSYGGTFITDKYTKIAVLQIGYADGLSRTLSNKLKVKINGKTASIIGNVCMDTCMIDITDIDVKVGDEAVIFDYDNENIQKIAELTQTINYEVITNIGKRVDREYINE